MKAILAKYKLIHHSLFYLFAAQLLINLIDTSFLLIYNIHLRKVGFDDSTIGIFTATRYLGVLLFALPVGFWLGGKKIKPFFMSGAISVPIISLLLLYFVHLKIMWLIYITTFLWGMSFVFMQVGVLPFIIRIANSKVKSESIALLYTNFSAAQLIAGLSIYLLDVLFNFQEQEVLLFVIILGFLSPFLVAKIREEYKTIPKLDHKVTLSKQYNWKIIFQALLPNLLLTVGAGLTMPFMNLFFFNVFSVPSSLYGRIASITAFIAIIGILIIPSVKNKFGFKVSITFFQSISVMLLLGLASTEIYADFGFALPLAFCFFILRQPFMHVAVPMTRELIMFYVGEGNREIMSALISGLRSGSYFFSGFMFAFLRDKNVSYSFIFLITAILYVFGIIFYHRLIIAYQRKE